MKKMVLPIFLILIILSGFFAYYYYLNNGNNKNIKDNYEKKEENLSRQEELNIYNDNNPIILGLYKYYGKDKNRELIKEYSAKWQYHTDISSFEVYYTKDNLITGSNQIKTFDLYKNKYEDIEKYKIGYNIKFNTNDKNINKTIISPKDTEEFYDYLEIYLYDDYHRNGGWYSHTTEEEYDEKTLLTSIKLTAGKFVEEINSDIIVTAFTYDNDDFDEFGNYKGVSKYSIVIKKIV